MAPIRLRTNRRANASNGPNTPMVPNPQLVKEEPMDPCVNPHHHHHHHQTSIRDPKVNWPESLQQLMDQLEASRLKEAEAVRRVEEQLLNIQWRLDRLQQQVERRPSPSNNSISPASSFTSGPHPPFHPHLSPHFPPHHHHHHHHNYPHQNPHQYHQDHSADDESDSSWPRLPPPAPIFQRQPPPPPPPPLLMMPRRDARVEPYPRQGPRQQKQQYQKVKGVRCEKCGKAGHYTKNCWIKVVKKCNVCNRPGHYNWECRNAKTAAGQRFVDAMTIQPGRASAPPTNTTNLRGGPRR